MPDPTDEKPTSLELYDEPLTPSDIAMCLVPLVGDVWTLYKREYATPRFRRRSAISLASYTAFALVLAATVGLSYWGISAVAIGLGLLKVVLMPSKKTVDLILKAPD